MRFKLILASIFFILFTQAFSQQSLLHKSYTLSNKVNTLGELLEDVQQQTGLSFSYNSQLVNKSKTIETPAGTYLLKDLLKNILEQQGVEIVSQGQQLILVPMVFSSEPVEIRGTVQDSSSLLPLIGATVYIPELQKGVATDLSGKFTFQILPGPLKLSFSLLGYKTVHQYILLKTDTTISIKLAPTSIEIKEVIVEDSHQKDPVQNLKIGSETLDMESVESMPAMFGEVDVIKSLQMLPGVQSTGEGLSGLVVRGSSSDQTLVMLNNTTIYSPAHFLGFFSVFNPEAIKGVEVYKGGIPARWGGRISSIINSQLKTGSLDSYKVSGGVGLISSRLSAEGPIVKNKASFLISGRRTYFDLLLNLIPENEVQGTSLYFYDFNTAFQYQPNPNNHFSFFTYNGDDVARLLPYMRIKWGNQAFSGEWLHSFNPNLLVNTSLHYSRYGYGFTLDQKDELELVWNSHLKEYSIRVDFDYSVNHQSNFSFGYNAFRRNFSPVYLFIKENKTTFGDIQLDQKQVLEHALYFHNEHKLSDQLSLQYGLRYSMFHNLGPGRIFLYQEEGPKTLESIKDTLTFSGGRIMHTYHGPEPRIIGRYSFSDSSSVKFSYNRMRQYTQVASNATASLPYDRWIPSDNYLHPQIADQWGLGYFSKARELGLNFSAEVYYKQMRNQLDFKDGVTAISNLSNQNADVIFNNALETQLVSGKGWSYGLELMLKKKEGPFTGWISYTLSRTRRQIEGINKGQAYSPRYDRPHDISLVSSYQFTKRLEGGLNWVYTSGSAVTLPEGKYTFEGKQLAYYNPDARNNSRLPDYHRLDLSLTLHQKKNANRRWQGSWTFSLYNAYMRKNPFLVQFMEVINNDPTLVESGVGQVNTKELKGVKMFFTLIPAISYNFSY